MEGETDNSGDGPSVCMFAGNSQIRTCVQSSKGARLKDFPTKRCDTVIKRINLFGGVKRKLRNDVVYRKPNDHYELYIERFCLRAKSARKASFSKKDVITEAQIEWKKI